MSTPSSSSSSEITNYPNPFAQFFLTQTQKTHERKWKPFLDEIKESKNNRVAEAVLPILERIKVTTLEQTTLSEQWNQAIQYYTNYRQGQKNILQMIFPEQKKTLEQGRAHLFLASSQLTNTTIDEFLRVQVISKRLMAQEKPSENISSSFFGNLPIFSNSEEVIQKARSLQEKGNIKESISMLIEEIRKVESDVSYQPPKKITHVQLHLNLAFCWWIYFYIMKKNLVNCRSLATNDFTNTLFSVFSQCYQSLNKALHLCLGEYPLTYAQALYTTSRMLYEVADLSFLVSNKKKAFLESASFYSEKALEAFNQYAMNQEIPNSFLLTVAQLFFLRAKICAKNEDIENLKIEIERALEVSTYSPYSLKLSPIFEKWGKKQMKELDRKPISKKLKTTPKETS